MIDPEEKDDEDSGEEKESKQKNEEEDDYNGLEALLERLEEHKEIFLSEQFPKEYEKFYSEIDKSFEDINYAYNTDLEKALMIADRCCEKWKRFVQSRTRKKEDYDKKFGEYLVLMYSLVKDYIQGSLEFKQAWGKDKTERKK